MLLVCVNPDPRTSDRSHALHIATWSCWPRGMFTLRPYSWFNLVHEAGFHEIVHNSFRRIVRNIEKIL